MDARELARWTRFAEKGGIGKCTAIIDCVAQEMGEDLMFLKDDQITVLMQLQEEGFYLGYCEDIVGRFSVKDVRFHGKLKKAVRAKRTSIASGAERVSIAVVERSPSVGKDRDDGSEKEGRWDRRMADRPGSRGKRSPSPTHSEKSLARSFASVNTAMILTDKEEGGSKEGRYGRHSKAPGMANSMSGSSVYSLRSARSVSTATSVSAYSTTSAGNSSSISDLTETEHTGLGRLSPPSFPFAPSDGLAAASGAALTSPTTHGSTGGDTSDSPASVHVNLPGVGEDPSFTLSATMASGSVSASNLPAVAPLRLLKSPRHIPTGSPSSSSPVHSSSSVTPSPGTPPLLSAGLSGFLASLPSSLSPGPPRALSPGSPAPSPGLSGSPGFSISLLPGLPGSHSPSPRSPIFPMRSQLHISSGTSTSSSPLPNPYGPSSSSPYVTVSGGHIGLSPPLSAPPTGPLPPAPQSGQAGENPAGEAELEAGEGVDEIEEGNSTRLSTLDAFRRRLYEEDEDEDEDHSTSANSQDDELGGWLGRLESKPQAAHGHTGDEKGLEEVNLAQAVVHGEDGNSDGEVGIGLSLMSALDDGSDDDVPLTSPYRAVDMGKRRPSAPSLQGQSPNGDSQFSAPSPPTQGNGTIIDGHDSCPESQDGEDGDCEEEDDEGGYWDDIYDDYRYSRYSLASKRFSIASRRMSVVSKVSAGSKGSSTSKSSRAPPVPVPTFSPDHPNFSVERPILSTNPPSFERPSFGSDRPSEYSEQEFRPSLESSSPLASAGFSTLQSPDQPLSSSFDLSLSDDARSSSYSTQTLDRLSSQFPAVPTGVPVRVESRLRIVNDGHIERGEDVHWEKEMEVMHESITNDTPEGGEADAKQILLTGNESYQNGTLSSKALVPPLSSPTIHSPHASCPHTDTEDGLGHDHNLESQRRMHSDDDDDDDLWVGGLKSPFETEGESIEGGSLASTLRAKIEGIRGPPAIIDTLSNTPGIGSGSKTIVSDNANGARDGMDDSLTSSSADTSQTVTAPPSTSSTPMPQLPATEQQPQHTIREPNKPAHPFSRSSIFLPHPNAPKPTGHQGLGPMYARPAQSHTGPPSTGPDTISYPSPPNSSPFAAPVLRRLRNSLAHAPGPGAPARRPPMTLFARCQPDLSASTGPVPIIFSLEPLPPLPSPSSGRPSLVQTPTSAMFPMRSATLPLPLLKSRLPASVSALSGEGTPAADVIVSGGMKEQISSISNVPSLPLPRRLATPSIGPSYPAKESVRTGVTETETVASTALPIPRAGFMPQIGGVRPRSRSFSAFGTKIADTRGLEKSHEEPAPISSVSPRPLRPDNAPPVALKSRRIPSRLVLQGNVRNEDVVPPHSAASSVLPPISPLPKSATGTVSPSPVTSVYQCTFQPPASNDPKPIHSTPTSPAPLPSPIQREKDVSGPTGRTSASSNLRNVPSPLPWPQTRHDSMDAPHKDSIDSHLRRQSSDSGDSRSVMQSPPPLPDGSQTTRSSPLAHEIPLRSKLSLPALRGKTGARPRLDDTLSIASSQIGLGGSAEHETVQVQDMDFELVKPTISHITGRPSQDSTLGSHELHIEPSSPGPLADTSSMHSSAPRSPLVANEQAAGVAVDSQAAADAHRQREVRWMALLPAVPPSQARKNKKVKRLLQDGVPSSLRYLIWCHLADSKARALPGVYAKLGKRPHVPVFTDIEKDVMTCFPDQPQLHNAQGPVVSLLQAYLSMVPDIQYSAALTSIAGHILLLAPEEDAFWIFTSMMDAHLRPYFSASTIQMEVDAALLSKAIEVNDVVLHKKIYVTLQMSPTDITRSWFSSLFVGTLPVDYLHRIWDVFLYEGMTFLFRVGLAIMHCIRNLLLQATSETTVLDHLSRPPITCLPSSPDEIVSLAFNMKLKDDDVRKQRIKMEAQVKKHTQARAHPTNSDPSRQAASISLPRL